MDGRRGVHVHVYCVRERMRLYSAERCRCAMDCVLCIGSLSLCIVRIRIYLMYIQHCIACCAQSSVVNGNSCVIVQCAKIIMMLELYIYGKTIDLALMFTYGLTEILRLIMCLDLKSKR